MRRVADELGKGPRVRIDRPQRRLRAARGTRRDRTGRWSARSRHVRQVLNDGNPIRLRGRNVQRGACRRRSAALERARGAGCARRTFGSDLPACKRCGSSGTLGAHRRGRVKLSFRTPCAFHPLLRSPNRSRRATPRHEAAFAAPPTKSRPSPAARTEIAGNGIRPTSPHVHALPTAGRFARGISSRCANCVAKDPVEQDRRHPRTLPSGTKFASENAVTTAPRIVAYGGSYGLGVLTRDTILARDFDSIRDRSESSRSHLRASPKSHARRGRSFLHAPDARHRQSRPYPTGQTWRDVHAEPGGQRARQVNRQQDRWTAAHPLARRFQLRPVPERGR